MVRTAENRQCTSLLIRCRAKCGHWSGSNGRRVAWTWTWTMIFDLMRSSPRKVSCRRTLVLALFASALGRGFGVFRCPSIHPTIHCHPSNPFFLFQNIRHPSSCILPQSVLVHSGNHHRANASSRSIFFVPVPPFLIGCAACTQPAVVASLQVAAACLSVLF